MDRHLNPRMQFVTILHQSNCIWRGQRISWILRDNTLAPGVEGTYEYWVPSSCSWLETLGERFFSIWRQRRSVPKRTSLDIGGYHLFLCLGVRYEFKFLLGGEASHSIPYLHRLSIVRNFCSTSQLITKGICVVKEHD
jgi:hypothetical protein